MDALSIKIAGVSKQYRLGAIGGRTLQEELQSWWAKNENQGLTGENQRSAVGKRSCCRDT